VSIGKNRIRLSVSVYNDSADVDRAIHVLST
jgi:selenocysteine lyase/cysteine desulfurase